MRPHLNTLNLRSTKRTCQASNQYTPRKTASSSLLRDQTASGDPIGAAGVFSFPASANLGARNEGRATPPFMARPSNHKQATIDWDHLKATLTAWGIAAWEKLATLLTIVVVCLLIINFSVHASDVYSEIMKHHSAH